MKIERLKNIYSNNSKIAENYFFMTLLNVTGSLVGIIIYPYLIRALGAEEYGSYVFALSVCSYFFVVVTYGFSMPALKQIALNQDNPTVKNSVVSCVFTAKLLLFLIVGSVFAVFVFAVPFLARHKVLYLVCFGQIIADVLIPTWYFQGVQKMKINTIAQATGRILTVPATLLLVHSPSDVWLYAAIVLFFLVLGALACVVYLYRVEGIRMRLVPLGELRAYFKDGLPFLLSSSVWKVRQESVTVVIGLLFGMTDVAVYDLANKIILIPRMLTMNINKALFPKIVSEMKTELIRRVIRYNFRVGLVVMLFVILSGYWLVLFLGGSELIGAYPLTVILSSSVLASLIVGSYIDFVFTPNNRYYFVTQSQVAAFIVFILLCVVGLLLVKSVYVVVTSLVLSGFCEIIYCFFVTKKYRLLR